LSVEAIEKVSSGQYSLLTSNDCLRLVMLTGFYGSWHTALAFNTQNKLSFIGNMERGWIHTGVSA